MARGFSRAVKRRRKSGKIFPTFPDGFEILAPQGVTCPIFSQRSGAKTPEEKSAGRVSEHWREIQGAVWGSNFLDFLSKKSKRPENPQYTGPGFSFFIQAQRRRDAVGCGAAKRKIHKNAVHFCGASGLGRRSAVARQSGTAAPRPGRPAAGESRPSGWPSHKEHRHFSCGIQGVGKERGPARRHRRQADPFPARLKPVSL